MSARSPRLPRVGRRTLVRDVAGLAFIEFAMVLPVFVGLAMVGLEIANYVTVRMRVSQVALHLADHAARLGEGSQLAAKQLTEKQINDVLTGAGLQASDLNLYTNGRVILSSLEPVASPNTTDRYLIKWQRCRGSATQSSSYGAAGATQVTGIGPTGSQVKAPDDGATMFVEVHYRYQPLIASSYYIPPLDISDTASMVVRDRRDTTQVYNPDSAAPSSC